MNRITSHQHCVLALALAALVAASPALADKDKGEKHGRKHQRYEQRHDDRGGDVQVSVHFGERQRTVVREYYQQEFRKGHCPPGLAKKHNGCMPPGQAKRWAVGRPLPRDVVYYDLPPAIVIELGPPPPRHRYVRVASDILLIAIGTGMVVDAIDDLSHM